MGLRQLAPLAIFLASYPHASDQLQRYHIHASDNLKSNYTRVCRGVLIAFALGANGIEHGWELKFSWCSHSYGFKTSSISCMELLSRWFYFKGNHIG
jgi:hypothetical protein